MGMFVTLEMMRQFMKHCKIRKFWKRTNFYKILGRYKECLENVGFLVKKTFLKISGRLFLTALKKIKIIIIIIEGKKITFYNSMKPILFLYRQIVPNFCIGVKF